MGSTTLPTGIPRLDALVRAEAERRTQDIVGAFHVHRGMLSDHTEGALVEAMIDLLRNLDRRESRDWATTTLAGIVGVEVGATAPSWYWSAEVRDTTDADGAPEGDGWPAGWWLSNDIGDLRFFSAEDWCADGDAHTHVPNLPNGRENAAPALAQALAAVCRDG